jgi:hypothetical protein
MPKSWLIVGNDTFTMLESSVDMNVPMATAANTSHRLRVSITS